MRTRTQKTHTRTKKTLAGVAAVMLIGACSGTDAGDVEDGIDDATATAVSQAEDATGTTLSAENADAVAQLQTSMDAMATELQEADVDPTLEVAWTEIEARVTDAVENADAEIDSSEIMSMMDTIESQIDIDASSELGAAWAEFKADFEAFAEAS